MVTAAQVALGISTLLYYVPVSLGALHQANALNLFTAVIGLMHTLRVPKVGGVGALRGNKLNFHTHKKKKNPIEKRSIHDCVGFVFFFMST